MKGNYIVKIFRGWTQPELYNKFEEWYMSLGPDRVFVEKGWSHIDGKKYISDIRLFDSEDYLVFKLQFGNLSE